MDLVSIETPSENDLIEELITGGEKVLPDDISKILQKLYLVIFCVYNLEVRFFKQFVNCHDNYLVYQF